MSLWQDTVNKNNGSWINVDMNMLFNLKFIQKLTINDIHKKMNISISTIKRKTKLIKNKYMWDNIQEKISSDLNVKKFIFTQKDSVCEAVLYKYPEYLERTVICCSVQSGCPIGCRFCGTGDNFVRSLTSDEILFQVNYLLGTTGIDPNEIKRLQIMTMSMGEPMLNWKALKPALIELYKMYPKAALLISTSGPRTHYYDDLIELAKEIPTIGLQFSVHESTDEARNKLIPFENKLTLSEMSQIGTSFWFNTGRQAFFNYCVHDKNNTVEDADRLLAMFSPEHFQATLSVICERDENVAMANKRQELLAAEFTSMIAERGFSTRMFNPAGQDDIGGGCGQLPGVQRWMKENPKLAKPSVGFGLPKVHMPTELK